MTLYVWNIHLNANYGLGTIVVAADSVDEAQELALKKFDTIHEECYEYLYPLDEDDTEARNIRFEEYKADLKRQPLVVGGNVFAVCGSE